MSEESDQQETNIEEPEESAFKQMSLIDHLEELRTRLIICIITACVGTVGGWFVVPRALKILLRTTGSLHYMHPMDAFTWKIKLAFYIGLAITSPVLITEIWLFIAPALKKNERRFAFPTILSATLLFYTGVSAGVLMLPLTLKYLQSLGGKEMLPFYMIDKYLGFFCALAIGLGIAFETPVVLVLLAKLGVVSYKRLASGRKYAILISAVGAAVVNPSNDPVTTIGFFVTMYLFFEISLLIIRFIKPVQLRKNQNDINSD